VLLGAARRLLGPASHRGHAQALRECPRSGAPLSLSSDIKLQGGGGGLTTCVCGVLIAAVDLSGWLGSHIS
jgi:hypothetical protein